MIGAHGCPPGKDAMPHLIRAKTIHARMSSNDEAKLRFGISEARNGLELFKGIYADSLTESCRAVYDSLREMETELVATLERRFPEPGKASRFPSVVFSGSKY